MSKIDELIEKLCPNGVEYKNFNDIANYIRGVTYNKYDEIKKGNNGYKLLRANNIILESNTINFDDVKIIDFSVKVKDSQLLKKDDILICAGSGSKAHIGKVAYIFEDMNYTFGGFMGVIRVNRNLSTPRYLFHILTSPIFKNHLEKVLKTSTINNINNDTWVDFKIPVPPLEIQSEIVYILDKFTALLAELKAELKARKKQYAYYRDKFVNKEKNKCLIDVLKIRNGKDYKEFEKGNIPVYGSGGIIAYTSKFAYDKPSVLIPRKGSLNKLYYVEEPFWNVDTIFYTEIDEKIAIPKYVFYCLENEHLEELNIAGAVPSLTQSTLNNIKIFIPDLEEQKKIVDILDKLYYLTNSLTEGIPAEIEARQQQYEYYRDKLLTFKELEK